MKAVIYGAGSIGRGFIGELMHISGYDIILIDVNKDLLSKLKSKKEYTLEIINSAQIKKIQIPIIDAIDGNDVDAIIKAVSGCDIIFTAVGADALKYITPNLAEGLKKRIKPVNIILCENMQDAHIAMGELLQMNIPSIENVGLLRASVGRMVPLPVKGEDPLIVKAEPYYHLPIDADAIVGEMPEFKGLEYVSPFDFAIDRKLYIHNLGHAASAWVGSMYGCNYIWECMEILKVKKIVKKAMQEAACALVEKYECKMDDLTIHIDDLLLRFSNKGLGDTVSRVGRDTKRKLSESDRVVGILNLCMQYNLSYDAIIKVFKAGLKFINDDAGTIFVQNTINEKGIGYILENICGLEKSTKVYERLCE